MRSQKTLIIISFLFIVCIFNSSLLYAEESALVYVIDIRTEIGGGVHTYIKKGIQKAEDMKADVIIFDIDTPGGKVDSAVKIVRSIQDTKIPTIAFVNKQAISAGAMISTTCTQIVMTSGSTIGDVAPVDIQGNEAGEKIISYIRTTFRSIVEDQQISPRNPDIVEAMVDKKLVLVRLENGDIIKLRPEEYYNAQETGEQMQVLCAEGELLTLTTRQALEYKFAEAQAETMKELLSKYQIIQVGRSYLKDDNDVVTMALTEEDFLSKQEELGIAQVKVIKTLENAKISKFVVTLADRLVFFITSPYISALLLSLGGLGLLVEIRTPGFGIPGMLGMLFIGLFFGGHMLNQIPHPWMPVIFVIGLAFIVLEVFVIPGFGIAGILGLVFMLGSVFYVFFQSTDDIATALLWLSISVILTSILGILTTIYLPKSTPFQRFALSTVMSTDEGYHSAGTEDFQSFLGKTGVALTPLRPAGTARIDNKRLDVVTVGDFIAQNSPVRVLEVEGSKVSVEALEE